MANNVASKAEKKVNTSKRHWIEYDFITFEKTNFEVAKLHWKVWLPPKGQKYKHIHTCLSHLIYHNATFNKEGQGGIFAMTITGQFNQSNSNWTTNVLILVPDNKVSILWQIPQYIIITAGEILFSITGLEFSYSQAPVSMKSVIQAIWLFTVALGDVIVVVVVESIHIENLAYEMFLFAGVMVFVMIIFELLSIFYYKYTFLYKSEGSTRRGHAKIRIRRRNTRGTVIIHKDIVLN